MTTRIDSRLVKTNNTVGSTILEERIQELIDETATKVDADSANQPDGYAKLDSLGRLSPAIIPTTVPGVTWMSRNGYGCIAFLKDGDLWTVVSSIADVDSSGRGSRTTLAARGLKLPGKVYIPSDANIVEVGGFSKAVAFALMDNGELWTWGENANGPCGLGHTTTTPFPTLSATDVTNVYWHRSNNGYPTTGTRLFIKKTDGKIYGTGYNGNGQLGIGNTTSQNTWIEIKKTGDVSFDPGEIIQFYNLGSQYGISVAITETAGNRKIWLCGYNGNGGLGNGTTSVLNYFTDLTLEWTGLSEGPFTVHDVTGGFGYHTGSAAVNTTVMMLIEIGGTKYVKACGNNTWGQLGDGTTTQKTTPITITTTGNPVAVVNPGGGIYTTLILQDNKELWGCGHNVYYQLATPGDTANKTSLILVTTDVDEIITDSDQSYTYPNYSPVIVRKGTSLYSWGYNTEGQCGVGTTAHVQTPIKINIPPTENDLQFGTAILAGREQVFYIYNAGKFYIWGQTLRDLLSSNVNTLAPVEVKLPI